MKKLLQSCIVIFFVSATVFGEAVDNKIAREIKTIDIMELRAAANATSTATSIIPQKTKPAAPLKKVTDGDLIKLEFIYRDAQAATTPGTAAIVGLWDSHGSRIDVKLPTDGFSWYARLPSVFDKFRAMDRRQKLPTKYVFCRVLSLSSLSIELLGYETKTDNKVTHFSW